MKRPQVTQEMRLEAARMVAAESEWGDHKVDDMMRHWRSGMNGYELAKELESCCGWKIDLYTVEQLDSLHVCLWRIHQKACRDWVKEHNIQPPLPVGTMTTDGEITEICPHTPAYYLIRPHDAPPDSSDRLIVPFEDVRVASAEVPA